MQLIGLVSSQLLSPQNLTVVPSGRSGWCVTDLDNERNNLTPLLDQVISHVPSPDVDNSKPFAMLATLLNSDPYLGRCLVGRVEQGSAKINDSVHALNL